VRQIVLHGAEREIAVAGDSVTLVLADDLDIARGDLIADPARPPREQRALDTTLVWMDPEPLRPGGRYLVQQASRRALCKVAAVRGKLDVLTLKEVVAAGDVVGTNDIVRAQITLQVPLFVDSYEVVPATGALILIDEATNRTVAAGLVE
jgi:sulfate adenylyltransferase subunit 1